MGFYRSHVLVCGGGGCISSGCMKVKDALIDAVEELGLSSEVKIIVTGCMGPCHLGPMMMIYPEGVLYTELTEEGARKIAREHLYLGHIVDEYLTKSIDGKLTAHPKDSEFFSRQLKIALRNTGIVDPMSIEEYIAFDGYRALGKALTSLRPEEVIGFIRDSGLKGRGGAGFLTGLKWSFTAKAPGKPKYVLCNADEGDPGAFMDRSILEGDPHSIVEAMAIAGYAVGADRGYVYVRAEYPLAIERLGHAIEQARSRGLLGEDIFESGFNFDLDIKIGAGAFVCGEETALIASAEGKRGIPRPKPPFPAQEGYMGKPTLVNNVETLANICPIILNGPDWFRGYGTAENAGSKVFALAGNVNNTGLIEVPMGTSLGDIIYDIGGGIPKDKKFKAAQTGGPSGGCIPKEFLNVPVDYESLSELGTIMGSGGLIVLDEDTCMVDFAKFFLQFVQDESCGKCVPCRVGTKRMLEILEDITQGRGREGDIDRLIELGETIASTSLCGLGQTAPNPVLTTIKYFRDEYEAHIKDKKCPASVCAALFHSPCQNACPAGVEVPMYIDAIRKGDYAGAVKIIREDNPFPAVCGRVCSHECEFKCQREQIDEPIAIRALKRFAAEYDYLHPQKVVLKSLKGKRVAIIGAGPAGLTAAYYLAREGYEVAVFETLPVAGGMLAVGIPDYRLPRNILKSEIDHIKSAGVKIITEQTYGVDFTLQDLKDEGFEAVFLAAGAHEDVKLGVPGEELVGVFSAVNILREQNLYGRVSLGKRTAIIGGGNAAIDAARTALRCGAEEVDIFYRRSREEMPAQTEEIEDAEVEGVNIHYYTAPIEILGKGNKVDKIRIQRMRPGDFDKSGRRKPMPIPNSDFDIRVDSVIVAIGQRPSTKTFEIESRKNGTVAVDVRTLETSIRGVFAGGDCISGPSTVIEAIKCGHLAALSIDKDLGGDLFKKKREYDRRADYEPDETPMARCKMQKLDPSDRRKSFEEVAFGLTEEEAYREAYRCLRCDIKDTVNDEQTAKGGGLHG